MRVTGLLVLAGTVLLAAAAIADDQPLAFVGARIIPIDGPEIDKGTLVVAKGKIVAVGPEADVEIPAEAKKIDVAGKIIMPGLVDTHSHIGGSGGLGGADGSGPIQPGVRIYDSINVLDSGFKRAAAGGLTTLNVMPGSGHLISGQTIYLKLRLVKPKKVDDFFILEKDGSPMGGLKMANGTNSMRDAPFPGTRGKSAFLVREQYIKAREYHDKVTRAGRRRQQAAAPRFEPGGPGRGAAGQARRAPPHASPRRHHDRAAAGQGVQPARRAAPRERRLESGRRDRQGRRALLGDRHRFAGRQAGSPRRFAEDRRRAGKGGRADRVSHRRLDHRLAGVSPQRGPGRAGRHVAQGGARRR